jgi:hypothetical protein
MKVIGASPPSVRLMRSTGDKLRTTLLLSPVFSGQDSRRLIDYAAQAPSVAVFNSVG